MWFYNRVGSKARKTNKATGLMAPPETIDSAIRCETSTLPRELFDDALYIHNNADIADYVAAGKMTAYDHYITHGFNEERLGRRPRMMPSMSPSLSVHATPLDALYKRVIDLEIEKRALLEAWDRQLPNIKTIDFRMLSETIDEALLPPLDRADCDESGLDDDQRRWRDDGYVIKKAFIPDELIDRYVEVRSRNPNIGGWTCPVPYMHIPELRNVSLYPPLMKLMQNLIGEEMGLHLNLTGWVSTDRNWHQDDYLNPPFINSWYAAVWVALDDIHPDCGPFEFVPGSHKWALMKGHKVRMYLTPAERNQSGWPALAERFVNGIAEDEIKRSGLSPQKFIAQKGDILIWHGRLMHRGSYANVPGMQRKTLISHYSGVLHRIDMPRHHRTAEGSVYFDHAIPIDFDPYVAGAAE